MSDKEEELGIVMKQSDDRKEFHLTITSEKPMTDEEIISALFYLGDQFVEKEGSIFSQPDYEGFIN